MKSTLDVLCEHFKTGTNDLEECFYNISSNGDLTEEIQLAMIKFARKAIKDCINTLPEPLSELNLEYIQKFRKELKSII